MGMTIMFAFSIIRRVYQVRMQCSASLVYNSNWLDTPSDAFDCVEGGMMPELDSHTPSRDNPDPLGSRFSPWHAAGADYNSYSAGMKRCSDLRLVGAVCRLAPGIADTVAAARRWEEIFGVPRVRDELVFTNARVRFVPGVEGNLEGLESITIAVEGEERMAGILDRARKEGLCGDGWINMVGVKWYFVHAGDAGSRVSDSSRRSNL